MNNTYKVLDHNYSVTDDNCAVSIFTVYNNSAKALQYVICDEPTCAIRTVDTINGELPVKFNYKDFTIDSFDWHATLVSNPTPFEALKHPFTDDDFELYKYCQFEFYKKYCATFAITVELMVQELPNSLLSTMTADAIEWHSSKGYPVLTDGYQVFNNDAYVAPYDKYAQIISDFKQWFDSIPAIDTSDSIYAEPLMISFAGKSLRLDFTASSYNAISEALLHIINEES